MLGRYSSSCKVKLTVQRAAVISQLLGEDDQLVEAPSILNIVTGQVSKDLSRLRIIKDSAKSSFVSKLDDNNYRIELLSPNQIAFIV